VLDSETGQEVMHLFSKIHRQGQTLVVVTHDSEVAAWAERRIVFKDGQVSIDTKAPFFKYERLFEMRKLVQFISECCMVLIGLCSVNAWAQNADNWPENINVNALNAAIFSKVFDDLGRPAVDFTLRHSQQNISYFGMHPVRNHRYTYLIRFPMNIAVLMKSHSKLDVYDYILAGNEARINGLPLNIITAANEVDYHFGRTWDMSSEIKAKIKNEMRSILTKYIYEMYQAYDEATKDGRSGFNSNDIRGNFWNGGSGRFIPERPTDLPINNGPGSGGGLGSGGFGSGSGSSSAQP
jgi:hypothetical protein